MLKKLELGEWVELEYKNTGEKLLGFVTYKGIVSVTIEIKLNHGWESVDYSYDVERYIRISKCKETYFDNWKEMLIDSALLMGDKNMFMELTK